jgi:hypothetical protein
MGLVNAAAKTGRSNGFKNLQHFPAANLPIKQAMCA